MLKTYRIIPLVFILFLFGFTLITVAPVFAQTEGTRIPKMRGLLTDGGIMGRSNASRPPSRQVIQSNARIAELEAENARLLEQQRASADQSGGEVAQLNARIVESQSQVATLTTKIAHLEKMLKYERDMKKHNLDRSNELEAENTKLRKQQGAPADPFGGIRFDVMYDAPHLWREMRGVPCKRNQRCAYCSMPK